MASCASPRRRCTGSGSVRRVSANDVAFRTLKVFAIVSVLISSSIAGDGGIVGTDALGIKVLARAEECFSETVPPGATLNVAFTVTHGGKNDIDATLTARYVEKATLARASAGGAALLSSAAGHAESLLIQDAKLINIKSFTAVTDGSAEFRCPRTAAGGAKVTLCLSNRMARWTPKWVNFEFYRMPADSAVYDDHEKEHTPIHRNDSPNAAAAKPSTADESTKFEQEIEESLHKYANSVYQQRQSRDTMRQTETRHRDLVESTNSWLLFGTVAESVLVVVMALFQFWYLRKFLSVRGSIRPV